jgi:hypothetical protein
VKKIFLLYREILKRLALAEIEVIRFNDPSVKGLIKAIFNVTLALSLLIVLLICVPIILVAGSGMIKKVTKYCKREGEGEDE